MPDTTFIDTEGFLLDSSLYDERHWNTPLSDRERKMSKTISIIICAA